MARQKKSLTGLVFGKLTVLSAAENSRSGQANWLVLCACGVQKVVQGGNLKNGAVQSCGCMHREKVRKALEGQRFGRLLVLRAGHKDSSQNLYWVCLCDCGAETEVQGGTLRKGLTKSCGCLQRETATTHGMESTKVYDVWAAMKARCQNPKHAAWGDYGGRGISVCARWQAFENFFSDMGEAPAGLTLDRIDNDGNYEPGNCRWADWATQNTNKGRKALKE